jgi:hypothetical protein
VYRILFRDDTDIPSPCKHGRITSPLQYLLTKYLDCQTGVKCCIKTLEKFKESITAELPLKIDEEIGTLFGLKIGTKKSKLKDIIRDRTEDLFQTIVRRELGQSRTLQSSVAALQKIKYRPRQSFARPENRGQSPAPNTIIKSMSFSTRNSRRRANSELSSSPTSSNPLAKRLQLDE